jgi:Ca2+-binding RTX toxin-like protein
MTTKLPFLVSALILLGGLAGAQGGSYHGTEGPDFLPPADDDANYFGEGGDDVLMGGEGWDYLYGGKGMDLLFDTSGLDVFDGAYDCEVDVIYAVDDPDDPNYAPDAIDADVVDIIICDPDDVITVWDCDGHSVFKGHGDEYYAWVDAELAEESFLLFSSSYWASLFPLTMLWLFDEFMARVI